MKITIPKKFEEILSKNGKIHGVILKVTSDFSDWLTDNKTEFFPEYTDHGVDHIDSVLKTASEIITEDSYQLMTPQDMYVLVMAVLLHDCAMHINRDGLWDLLTNDLYNGVSLGLDDEKVWADKWEDFCADVRRFTEQDWNIFFGEYREVDIPEVGCKSLNDNQKVIIGDFVRRYHATIAQVIVNNGIPSKGGPIKIFDSEFHYLNQLSGFVARSHNYSLRTAIDILGEERKREHRDTHPTYLMGVLRIADYMQFKSDRTPKILFTSKAFCSPISIREWKKHLAIISTNNSHPDEELLFVEAFPEDAITLSSVGRLLKGFQKELDEFWACSGEVYSRYPSLSKFSLAYRRVKSNIDNPKDYVQKNHKSYHPEILSIEADNQKLFPLLVKPLYGDIPEVGLRELLQNAIDACNERYCLDVGREVNKDSIPYGVKIILNFNDMTLTICDSGMGMTVETVKNYFLKIGASYRTSESWKANYSNENNVYIPRTGKFGIGMLAGFLIGDEIEVHTAHFAPDSKAVKFGYKVDSSDIEVTFQSKIDVGTTIKVYSTEDKLRSLEKSLINPRILGIYYYENNMYKKLEEAWWYYLDSPMVSVEVIKDENKTSLISPYLIKKDDLYTDWSSLSGTSLERYFWRRSYEHCGIFCNGILIKEAKTPKISIGIGIDTIDVEDLEICIFDNKGIFPINLTRDDVIGTDFYELDLLSESVKKSFVETLVQIFHDYEFSREFILYAINSYSSNDSNFFPVVFSRKNPIPFLVSDLNENIVFVDFIFANQKRGVLFSEKFYEIVGDSIYSCFLHCEKMGSTVDSAIGNIVLNKVSPSGYWYEWQALTDMEFNFNGWVFVKEYDYKKSMFFGREKEEKYGISVVKMDDGWIAVMRNGNEDIIPKNVAEIINTLDSKIFIFAIFKSQNRSTEFSDLWVKHYN